MEEEDHPREGLLGEPSSEGERTTERAAEPAPLAEPAPKGMIPARSHRRLALERVTVRLIATAGVVGIGVAVGAILASSDVAGWTIGLVVALVSVILSALLWSSREL